MEFESHCFKKINVEALQIDSDFKLKFSGQGNFQINHLTSFIKNKNK